jgi:protein-S-isoprenylcysteine O-methyltransferase Ste14
LGYRLASLGIIALYPSIESVAVSTVTFGLTEMNARFEEKDMLALFGDEYMAYKERVPRWIPYSNKLQAYVNKALDKVKDSVRD